MVRDTLCTRYPLCQDFFYYNMTTPLRKPTPHIRTLRRVGQLCACAMLIVTIIKSCDYMYMNVDIDETHFQCLKVIHTVNDGLHEYIW